MISNRITVHRSIATLAGFIAFIGMLSGTASAQSASSSSPNGLAGTWRVTVTLVRCDTQAPLGPPFQSLLSFHQGGTLTGTTTNPAFAPGQRSGDFGTWSFDGSNAYSAASEAYLHFTAGPFPAGTQRIEQSITVERDHFTSVATTRFFDVNHDLLATGCAVASGERFE